MKTNLRDLLKRWSETSEQLQANERRLSVKQSEIAGLQKDCEELRTNLSAKNEELTKLESLSKENVRGIHMNLLPSLTNPLCISLSLFAVHSH